MRRSPILFAALFLLTVTANAQAPAPPPQTLEGVFADRLSEFAQGPGAPREAIIFFMAERAGLLAGPEEILRQANDVRTDQQIGASSSSTAGTTLVDRPGIPELLAFAIERGALSKSVTGSVLTLSTTPYLIAGFFGVKDTPANWEEWRFLRRIGLSATFADDTAVETEGNFSSVHSGEAKFVLLGNRSARDAVLFARADTRAQIRRMGQGDAATTAACQAVNNSALLDIQQKRADLATWLATAADKSPAAVRAQLAAIVPSVPDDPATRAALAQCIAAFAAAENTADVAVAEIGAITKDFLAQNQKKQLSFAVSVHRDATIADYSTLKILYAYDMNSKLTLNLNGEGNFNNDRHPASGTALDRVRSYAIEAGGTLGRFKEKHYDATFGAKIWRDESSGGKTIVTASWKNTLYVSSSLQVPISLTYASRDVENMKKGIQLSGGLGSLLDHLLTSRVMKP